MSAPEQSLTSGPTVPSLAGRAALVTGAGVGIGRAIALALGGTGAFVGIHYHSSEPEADQTLAALREQGGDGVLLKADLSLEDEARSMVDHFIVRAKHLHILVNNAGSPVRLSKIEDCPADLCGQAFDLTVNSAFLVPRQAHPY